MTKAREITRAVAYRRPSHLHPGIEAVSLEFPVSSVGESVHEAFGELDKNLLNYLLTCKKHNTHPYNPVPHNVAWMLMVPGKRPDKVFRHDTSKDLGYLVELRCYDRTNLDHDSLLAILAVSAA